MWNSGFSMRRVADHIVFKNPWCELCVIFNGTLGRSDGTAGANGDGAFAAPTNFGSADFWFVEDNYHRSPARHESHQRPG